MRENFAPLALAAALMWCTGSAAAATGKAPARKPGLWELKTVTSAAGGQAATMQQCIDEKTDDLAQQRAEGLSPNACSKNEVVVKGSEVLVESVCLVEGSTATTRGRFSGRFDSAYRGELDTVYQPPLMGMAKTRTTIEARWLGPCKPGQKPGDVIMPGMGGFNTEAMMKNQPEMRELLKNNPEMQEMMKRMQR